MAFQGFVGVEVFTRGFDVAVAHELLHGHDIDPPLEEPGGVGMPKFVEGGVGDFRGVGDPFESSEEVGFAPAFLCRKDPVGGWGKIRRERSWSQARQPVPVADHLRW